MHKKTIYHAILLSVFFLLIIPSTSFALFSSGLSDEEITSAIKSDFLLNKVVPSNAINIESHEGIVLLTGSVDNLLAKERAVKITESIRGVRFVFDKIEVIPVERKDEELKNNLRRLLKWDPAVDSDEIRFRVEDGVVTLTGEVDSWQEKQLPTELAKKVSGVKDVINEIKLDYKINRPNEEIQADIMRRLDSDILIYAPMIKVEVEDGNVTLSGKVFSAREKQLARTSSWVAGVKHVNVSNLNVLASIDDNKKRVKDLTQLSDQQIKSAVQDTFLYDFRINPFGLSVKVDHHFVVLSGVVDNLISKMAAEEKASNIVGVWGVKNEIKVKPKEKAKDEDMAQHIADAMAFHPFLEKNKILVEVNNGKVKLTGTVESAFDKKKAEDVAIGIPGVIEIHNQLMISSSWPFKSDQEIKENIEREFFWSIYVDRSDIFVSVQNGRATLMGTVENWSEIKAAAKNAFEGGARSVETNLIIENGKDNLFVRNLFNYQDVSVFP